jgi:DeoR/GlpR family transcriptional regulator of sugar metabolism
MNHQEKELAPKRLDRVRQILRRQKVAGIVELAQQVQVSQATIRRDLNSLQRLGEVRRVHGGAVCIESRLEEPLFDDKTSIHAKEKRRIAQAALSFIQPEETIYLDGGSTVLELARLLRDRTNITIVTNSLRAVLELAGRGPSLIFIGGELRRLSQTVVGPLTRLTLEQLYLDRAFIGTIGLSISEGLTTTDPGEAYTKEVVMKQARQVILLADSSKVNKVSFVQAGDMAHVDVLITDRLSDLRFSREFQKRGKKLIQT